MARAGGSLPSASVPPRLHRRPGQRRALLPLRHKPSESSRFLIAEDQKIFSSVQKVSLYKYGQLAIHTLWEPRAIQCGQTLIPGKLRGPSPALDPPFPAVSHLQLGQRQQILRIRPALLRSQSGLRAVMLSKRR